MANLRLNCRTSILFQQQKHTGHHHARVGHGAVADLAHRRIRHQLTGYGDTIMVKRVASKGAGRLALLSQNLAYPPVEVSAEEVEIIGRVVWKGGRL